MSLNLSAYVPSTEDYDAIPSPLMDGDVPAAIEPAAEFVEPEIIEGVPVEQSVVELPPELDPTPLEPLQAEIIQEEVISENLDTEAGQLMGAQIALEGYQKLLRSSGPNMTRQSAAFMAVGMRRASRLMGVTSLGLENENSGTQVMAMQKANVDEKGVGAKLKEVGAKIWEWIKNKAKQFRDWLQKLRANKEKTKAEVTYLIAATKAAESGNPSAVKGLEAPSGIKVAQVLDAIHGEDVRAPKPGKKVMLPAKFVPILTRNGKLDLSLTVEHEVRTKVLTEFMKDATELFKAIASQFQSYGEKTAAEEVADTIADLVRKHLGGKAGKWELHGMTVERSADGVLSYTKDESASEAEVEIPSPQQIRQYLQDIEKVLNSDLEAGIAVAEAYEKAQMQMIEAGEAVDGRISREAAEDISRAIGKAMQGNSFEDKLRDIGTHLDRTSTVGAKACDFFLANLLGKGNTVSQEDFTALPSRGLAVIPGQQASKPGLLQRGLAAGKEGWRKLKEFFQRLWEQFSNWAKNLWQKVFGVEKNTDVLLLTNDAVPEDGQAGSSAPLALPTGTRLKSVQAARLLSGPSAEAPVETTPEPEVASPSTPSLPKGMVYVPEAGEIMVGGDIELDPVWEEAMVNWLIRHYIPTQEKIVRDLTSYAGSASFDDGIMGFTEVIERATPQLFQGMPTDNVPGQRTIAPGNGCKISVRQEGMMGEIPPIKIAKKRQIDQALSRQKKLLKALAGLEKSRVAMERQRSQLNSILDRRVASGIAEDAVTPFYNHMERNVIVSSATVIASVITKMCDARVAACDAMIAARAKGKA